MVEEWRGKVNKVGIQFHTSFVKGDPLMLGFGKVRNRVVDKIIALKQRYPDFIVNPVSQLVLMKGNWGGVGTTPVDCPSWAILSLDHMGRTKQPLHRKRGFKEHEADMRGVRPRLLFHTGGSGN